MTQLCAITGPVRDRAGNLLTDQEVTFTYRGGVVGSSFGALVPKVITARTTSAGEISMSLYSGVYRVGVDTDSGRLAFNIGVPDAASATFSDLIDESPPVTSDILAQAVAARDAAISAAADFHLTPAHFGAAGDGVTDDSAAVLAWLNYCVGNALKGIVAKAHLLSSAVTVDLSGTVPGEHLAIEGPGQNMQAFLVGNATGGITFNGTGVGRQHTVEIKNLRFEPTLTDSGYPFRIIGAGGGLSTQAGAILRDVYVGTIDETGDKDFSDGPQIIGLYRPQIHHLRVVQPTEAGNKWAAGLDIQATYFPVVRDFWFNCTQNLPSDGSAGDAGSVYGIKWHGTTEEGGFFDNCTVNGPDEGFSLERTGREPHFQWIGGHVNARRVGMRLNGVKYGIITSPLMYIDKVETGIDPVDFLIEDADGLDIISPQFRMTHPTRRHFILEPKAGKTGAVVRNITIRLTEASLFANTDVAPIYLNGATNVTIYLPTVVPSADFASYPERLVELGPSQSAAEVRIVTPNGIISLDAGGGSGPTFSLFRDSESPASSDFLGRVLFDGRNDAAERITYARVDGRVQSATDGAETGYLDVVTKDTGADEIMARFIRPVASGTTGLFLAVQDGVVTEIQPVTAGSNDSGGTGFRVLRIPNSV